MARGLVLVNTIIFDSLAHDIDVMGNDNLVTAISAQVQVGIALIGTVRKLPVYSLGQAMEENPAQSPKYYSGYNSERDLSYAQASIIQMIQN